MPPLRELAPQPMVCESKTATVAPDFASDLAAERPVSPAPIMATSTRCGSSRVTAAGISTVSSQNVFSCMERISLPIRRDTVTESGRRRDPRCARTGAHWKCDPYNAEKPQGCEDSALRLYLAC